MMELPVLGEIAPEAAMRNEVVELLRRARARIAEPEHWGKYFLSSRGRYCAMGALQAKEDIDTISRLYGFAVDYLDRAVPRRNPTRGNVGAYNDLNSTKHSSILKLYDRAIRAAEAMARIREDE